MQRQDSLGSWNIAGVPSGSDPQARPRGICYAPGTPPGLCPSFLPCVLPSQALSSSSELDLENLASLKQILVLQLRHPLEAPLELTVFYAVCSFFK